MLLVFEKEIRVGLTQTVQRQIIKTWKMCATLNSFQVIWNIYFVP